MKEKAEKYLPHKQDADAAGQSNDARNAETELELSNQKENLQNIIEALEKANQELKSGNKELQRTVKALQKKNEGLNNLNKEYALKIKELISLEEELQNYFSSTDISQIIVDKNLLIRKFTPAAVKLVNLIESDIGRPIHHLSTNVYYENMVDDIRLVIEKNTFIEKNVLSRTGHTYQLKIFPFIRQGMVVDGAIITFIDITRLIELNYMVTAVLDSSFIGILAFKAVRDNNDIITDFKFLLHNPAALQIIKMDKKAIEGKTLLEVFPEASKTDLIRKYIDVVTTGVPAHFETAYDKDGLNGWYELSAAKMDDGFVLTFADITKRKETEAELVKREGLYRTFAQNMPDSAVILFDEKMVITLAEGNSLNQLKYPADKILSKKITQINHDTLKTTLIKACRQVLKGKETILELEKDKKIYKVQVRPVMNKNEKIFGGIIVFQDVTDAKKAVEQLVTAEKLSLTANFARGIAHEVRNPLTNITLTLSHLQNEVAKAGTEGEEYIDIIERNCKRINNLIVELLKTTQPKTVEFEKYSIHKMLDESIELAADRLKFVNIRINKAYSKKDIKLPMDKEALKVAIFNLILNAIEASGHREATISIETKKEKDKVIINIKDTGKGMAPDEISRIFEPFYSAKPGGIGLGMTGAQSTIINHAGSIYVESEKGKGTGIILEFRLKQ